MKFVDKLAERAVRKTANQTSRRGFIGRLGSLIVGSAAIPLLPIARPAMAAGQEHPASAKPGGYPGVAAQPNLGPGEEGDPTSCDYWRYCGTSGPLCSCCGGSANVCPPGTEMSALAWIGTCHNPTDGKHYIISYNDCCGKSLCSRCLCDPTNPSEKPVIRPQASVDYIWCLGTQHSYPTCTTAVVIGVALDQGGQ